MLEHDGNIPHPGAGRLIAEHATKGQDTQSRGKDDDQKDAMDPVRDGGYGRKGDEHLIQPTAMPPGKRQRQADGRKEQQEIGRAGQEQGIAQALQDDRQHLFPGSEDPHPGPGLSGLPPVEGQAIAQPSKTADQKGLVQTGCFFHLPPGLLEELKPLLNRDILHTLGQMDDAIYATAPPESMASIVFRDPTRIKDALAILKPTARDLKDLGVIDRIIPSPDDVTNYQQMSDNIRQFLITAIKDLSRSRIKKLVKKRESRAKQYGLFKGSGRLYDIKRYIEKPIKKAFRNVL